MAPQCLYAGYLLRQGVRVTDGRNSHFQPRIITSHTLIPPEGHYVLSKLKICCRKAFTSHWPPLANDHYGQTGRCEKLERRLLAAPASILESRSIRPHVRLRRETERS